MTATLHLVTRMLGLGLQAQLTARQEVIKRRRGAEAGPATTPEGKGGAGHASGRPGGGNSGSGAPRGGRELCCTASVPGSERHARGYWARLREE
jgi:hypothetical protein